MLSTPIQTLGGGCPLPPLPPPSIIFKSLRMLSKLLPKAFFLHSLQKANSQACRFCNEWKRTRCKNFYPVTIFERTRCELASWLLRWREEARWRGLSLFSAHRKSQLTSSQRMLSNIMIGWKFSQRACELGFGMFWDEWKRAFKASFPLITKANSQVRKECFEIL